MTIPRSQDFAMRSFALLLVPVLILAPAPADAQLSILGGVGVTNPMQDLNGVADVGWHATGGMRLSVATVPVGLRADAAYHSFGEQGDNPQTSILSGALSLVVPFPGVGLRPYVLAGLGIYRTSLDVAGDEPVSDTGFHGAFGVDIGANGFGGFAEVRFVNVSSEAPENHRFVTATLGIRL